MPRTIVTEDGNTIEVPTEEELKALQDSAAKAEEFRKKAEDLEAAKSKYESDPVEKNWRELRAKTERLEAQIKEQGKMVAADGTISDAPKSLTPEEIEAKARAAARSELVGQQKKNLLSKFDDEKKKVVEHYLDKLTAGEDVSVDNIEKFVQEASLLAEPPKSGVQRTPFVNGQPPVFKNADGKSFAETEHGQSLANEVFGEESFAKKK